MAYMVMAYVVMAHVMRSAEESVLYPVAARLWHSEAAQFDRHHTFLERQFCFNDTCFILALTIPSNIRVSVNILVILSYKLLHVRYSTIFVILVIFPYWLP